MSAVVIYATCFSLITGPSPDLGTWQKISSNLGEAIKKHEQYEQIVIRAIVNKKGTVNVPDACEIVTLESVSGI